MSKMRGRILRGVGAGIIGQVLNVVGRLLLIPMFLHAWGAALYGEWLILSSAVAILALSDFGGQVYFVNRLTAEWARAEHEKFQTTLSTGFLVFLALPTIFALPLILAGLFLPLSSWLGLKLLDDSQTFLILLSLALQIMISLPQGLLLGIYRAVGRQATSMMLANGILALQLVLSALVLWLELSPVWMGWVQIFPPLLICMVAAAHIRTTVPHLTLFSFRYVSTSISLEAIRPSLRFLAIQLSQVFILQATVLVVGRTLGSVEVTIFSTVRTVVNSARQALGLLSHSAWPEFTTLEATHQRSRLEKLFFAVLSLSMTANFIVVAVLDSYGPQLTHYWLRGQLPYPQEVVHHFSIYILLAAFATLTSNVLMATNRHDKLAKWQVTIAVFGTLAFAMGLNWGGIAAAVLVLALTEALPACIIYAHLLINERIGITAQRLLMEAMILGALTALAWVSPVSAALGSILYFLHRLNYDGDGTGMKKFWKDRQS